jgi:putative flippase GtrA
MNLYSISKNKLNDHLELRYIFVGILNTAFAFCIFPLFYFFLESFVSSYQLILGVAYIATTSFAFLTQKHIVFRSNGSHVREFLRFLLLQIFIYILNICYLSWVLPFFNLNVIYVQITFTLLIFVISYFWNKLVTFNLKQ